VDDVILGTGDAEQMGELIDHQPYCWILADEACVCVIMLAHLTAGIGDRQRDAAGIAGARVDDHESVTEAAAMGAFWFRHE
jgi:hypothetical protein